MYINHHHTVCLMRINVTKLNVCGLVYKYKLIDDV